SQSRIINRRVVKWVCLCLRVVAVLDHQHDLGRLRIDLDPHDIEAAGFRGLDRAGYVLLAEIARRSGHYTNRLCADVASSSPISAALARLRYGESRVTTPSHGVALFGFAKA